MIDFYKKMLEIQEAEHSIPIDSNNFGVDQLEKFPFDTYDEILKAYEEKRISFFIKYSYSAVKLFGKHKKNIANNIYLIIIFLICMINIFLSVFTGNWIYSTIIVFMIIGLLTISFSVYLPSILLAISIILTAYFVYKGNQTGCAVSISYILVHLLMLSVRQYCYKTLLEKALQSEKIFTYLFIKKILIIKNNETKDYIEAINIYENI